MSKKLIITALFALVTMTGQSQTLKGLPDRVLNHQMDMTAPLPEPSFEIDTTTVRVHLLDKDVENSTKLVCLTVGSFFPYVPEHITGFTDDNGVATMRFQQRGTSRAMVSIGDIYSDGFYLWPGETADVYIDFERIEPACREDTKQNMTRVDYGISRKDTLRAEQLQRKVVTRDYGFDQQPAMWYEGRYADLNTALHRYVSYNDEHFGWDMNYELVLASNKPLSGIYADGVLAWHDHLKQRIESDQRLPLCAKQFCILGTSLTTETLIWNNVWMCDILDAEADSVEWDKYVTERPLTELQKARFQALNSNTNYRAYLNAFGIKKELPQKFWDAIGGDIPCDYLHDLQIVIDYPRHIALYGSLPEGAMKDVRMPYFHQLVQQLEAAEEGIDHEVYSDVLEDLKQHYKGKVVLIDFWATWCHGCIETMNFMEPLKDDKLSHPDLAFVYITDQTSPTDRWQDFRKRIRGEHLRVNEDQDEALRRRFQIRTLPFYVLMDRQGHFRELPLDHNRIINEL